MKFSVEHALMGLAIFAVAFHLGKRGAAGAGAPAAAQGSAASPADWWSYAGAWGRG